MFIPQRFKSGETLKTDIGPKLNQMVDFMKSLVVSGDKSTIAVKHLPGGSFISCLINPGGGGGSSTYTGPFAVTKNTDTSVRVLGYDASDQRYIKNKVYIGTNEVIVTEQNVTVKASGFVYLDVTPGYSVSIATAAETPVQEDGHRYIELAYVIVVDSKVLSIEQILHGQAIAGDGRFV